jgi:hypothetical protein
MASEAPAPNDRGGADDRGETVNPLDPLQGANDADDADDADDAGDTATPVGFPLPGLFLDVTRADQAPTTPERIATVDVRRIVPGRTRPVFLGYRLIEHLPDEDTVCKLYGPGDYELIGRNGNRSRILARIVHSVEAAPTPAPAPPQAAPAAHAAPARNASPFGTDNIVGMMFQILQDSRSSERELLLQMLQRSEQNGVNMVQAVSSLASARIADLKDMAKGGGGGNGGGLLEALQAGMKLYEGNMTNALEMAEAMQQGREGSSEVDIVKSIVEGVKAFKDDPDAERRIAVMVAEEQAKRAPRQ